MELAQAFCASIETALNRYISLDPDIHTKLSSLEGKIIALEILGLNQTISFFPSVDGFLMLLDFDGEVDATISGTPLAFVKQGLSDEPKVLIFKGEIVITGDSATANQFSQLLTQLDIDWEELLAQNIGDIAAHKLGNIFRGADSWIKKNKKSAYLDVGEYIQEEIKLSPANAELRQFINQVDELREGADRLATRINQLQNKK